MGRLIGLDFGTARVGVAISDVEQRVATPLEVIDGTKDHLMIGAVTGLVEEWEPVGIVVGDPINMDGSRGSSSRRSLRLAKRLGEATGIPVMTYDERLTTVIAHRMLDDGGVPSKNRRDMIDMVAAQVILQGWMDKNAYE